MSGLRKILPPLGLLFFLLVLGQGVAWLEWIPPYLLPSPFEVARVFWENQEILLTAATETFVSAGVGLLIAVVGGIALALLFVRFQILGEAIFPFTVLFQTVPIVAIAPLLVVWFGFGQQTVQISALIVSIFPILAGALSGLRQSQRDYLELFASFRASPQQILLRLRIPMALPSLLTGLQVASGLAVIGAIVGEFVAGTGLGSLIDAARTQQRVDMIFAAVFLAALVGLVFMLLVGFLKWFLRNYMRSLG